MFLVRLILLEVFFKKSQYMLTLLIAVWPLEDDTFEQILFFTVRRPLATTLMILLRKKLPSPNCLAVPYKVSPQSFLIAFTVLSPYMGSFAKPDKQNVCEVQKRFFWFLRGCISKIQVIRANSLNNIYLL